MEIQVKQFFTIEEEYEGFRQAIWDYLMDHSEIVSGGNFFVKFHMSNRVEFEKHVVARMVYGYHRNNPIEKEAEALRRAAKKEEVRVKNTPAGDVNDGDNINVVAEMSLEKRPPVVGLKGRVLKFFHL